MLFKNILVPYDGSSHSKHAFKIALDMAKKYNSKIKVITCLSRADTGASYIDNSISRDIFETAKSEVLKSMSQLKSTAKKKGISASIDVIKTESVVKQVVIYAKSDKIDLVIMGSHGRTGWKKLLLGSVANGVAQRVHCPVMIIK